MLVPSLVDGSSKTLSGPADGVSINASQNLHVDIKKSIGSADLLVLSLENDAGTKVASLEVDRNTFTRNAGADLALPAGLANGRYQFSWVLKTNGTTTEKGSSTIFKVADDFSIDNLQVGPLSCTPNSNGLARVKVHSSADVWLRWTLADKVVSEGFASAGFDTLLFKAPSTKGVYAIKVEVYPVAPADGKAYTFNAGVSTNAQFVVSDTAVPGYKATLFQPRSLYENVFFLEGNVLNEAGTLALKTGSSPILAWFGSMVGYQISASQAVQLADGLKFINGVAKSRSWDMLVMKTSDGESQLLTINRSDNRGLGLKLEQDGTLTATMHNGSSDLVARSPSNQLKKGVPAKLRLGLLSDAKSTKLEIGVDDQLVAVTEVKNTTDDQASDPGSATLKIGGGATFGLMALAVADGTCFLLPWNDNQVKGVKAIVENSTKDASIPPVKQGESLKYAITVGPEEHLSLLVKPSFADRQVSGARTISLSKPNGGVINLKIDVTGKSIHCAVEDQLFTLSVDREVSSVAFVLSSVTGSVVAPVAVSISEPKAGER